MSRVSVTRRQTYQEYMASSAWEGKRTSCLRRDRDRCRGCSTDQDLHVHHCTYERLGAELLDDLITLCGTCHGFVHAEHRRLGGDLAAVTETAVALIAASGPALESPRRASAEFRPRRAGDWRQDARGGGTWGGSARKVDERTAERRRNGL